MENIWRWILAWLKTLLLRIPFAHRSFIVLSSGRSGSTLLVQLLNCHPAIVCRGELLNREELKRHQLNGESSSTLVNYVLASLLSKPWAWIAYTGFKLFNEQLEYCNLPLRKLLLKLYYPPVVVLYRENLLEAYVSLKIAFQTDLWYSESIVNRCSIEVDWKELKEYIDAEQMRWKSSMAALSDHKKVMFVSFEELTQRQNETIKNIFSFLALGQCVVTATSKRQNPLPLGKKITNYQEILSKVSDHDILLTSEWLQSYWK